MLEPVFISASQLEKFERCNRQWGWRYIAGLKEPQGAAAAFGEEFHLHLENWVRFGTVPANTKPGELAKKLLPYVPAPKSENVITEVNFQIPELMVPGLMWTGKIDRFDLPSMTKPKVVDYKSAGDRAWAKTADMLLTDAQAVLYSVWAFESLPDVEEVELEWLYAFKRGGKPDPVRQTMTRDHAFTERARYVEVAREMVELRRNKPDPMTIKPNTRACDAFGGCAFALQCNITPSERFLAKMAQENEFIARLRKEREAKEAGGVAAPPAPLSSLAPPQAPAPIAAPMSVDALFAQQAPAIHMPAPVQAAGTGQGVLAHGVVPPDAAPRAAALAPMGQMSLEAKLAAATPTAPAAAPVQAMPRLDTPPPAIPRADVEKLFEQVIPAPTQKPVVQQAPAPIQQTPSAPAPATKKTTGIYGLLLIDCLNEKGSIPAIPLSDILLPLERKIAAANNIADYRLIDYAQGGALLSVMLAEELERNADHYGAISADSFSPSYKHLADVLKSRAAVVIRGV